MCMWLVLLSTVGMHVNTSHLIPGAKYLPFHCACHQPCTRAPEKHACLLSRP